MSRSCKLKRDEGFSGRKGERVERSHVIFHVVEISEVCLVSGGHMETSGNMQGRSTAWYKDIYISHAFFKSELLSMDNRYL